VAGAFMVPLHQPLRDLFSDVNIFLLIKELPIESDEMEGTCFKDYGRYTNSFYATIYTMI
jgi:hypothetical protein